MAVYESEYVGQVLVMVVFGLPPNLTDEQINHQSDRKKAGEDVEEASVAFALASTDQKLHSRRQIFQFSLPIRAVAAAVDGKFNLI